MKTIFTSILCILFVSLVAKAQDTMYIYQSDAVVAKQAVADIDSIVFYQPAEAITVTDYDGNVYSTVTIGTQTWTAENLKTTHYRNGEEIIWGYDNWTEVMNGPACTKYNASMEEEYGLLYNWYAVMDPRNLAPEGWHVATYSDVQTLVSFLGGEGPAYIALMEAGNAHWTIDPNTGTNSTGWTALPGGFVEDHGWSSAKGTQGYYWLASVTGPGTMDWLQFTTYMGTRIAYTEDNRKAVARSVRLVKD